MTAISTDSAPGLRDLEIETSYSTSTQKLFQDFYLPALSSASTYDRAAGYFASSVFALAPMAFSDFIARGGVMRLLCSPNLTAVDAEVLAALPDRMLPTTREIAITSLTTMANGTSRESVAVRAMSAMIAAGVLEIKFVTRSTGRGIFHDKSGAFADVDGDVVTFMGSANESAAAWSGWDNHEQLQVFKSWASNDKVRSQGLVDQFDEIWRGLRRGLVVTEAKDAADLITAAIPPEPLDEIIREFEKSLTVEVEIDAIPLRDYQSAVLESWRDNNDRGIVAFATGGGKTRTALEALRAWTTLGKPALVLVPSKLLHEQWTAEISALLPSLTVLTAGAGATKKVWMDRARDYLRSDESLGPRVVVATYQTAITADFLTRIVGTEDLLVIADEVHNAGAPQFRQFMELVNADARLGLSATPERYGDPEGSDAISHYFGANLDPTFGISEALESGVLVPYEYQFEVCELDDQEEEEWHALTSQIGKELASNKGVVTERAKMLMIRRSRIIKRAESKQQCAFDVLEKNYVHGDRWLVYCSDIEHLSRVREAIEPLKLPVMEYYSSDGGDHKATLAYFELRGGVLLAIKCLDEGVDIPLINKALILASSSNPREHIQRRGRVLRRSPGKYSAKLFDVVVTNRDGYAITPNEVTRAQEFANHAVNVGALVYLEQLRRPDEMSGEAALSDFDDATPSWDFDGQ